MGMVGALLELEQVPRSSRGVVASRAATHEPLAAAFQHLFAQFLCGGSRGDGAPCNGAECRDFREDFLRGLKGHSQNVERPELQPAPLARADGRCDTATR